MAPEQFVSVGYVHLVRIKSHKKNGPPRIAVITPTGSSSGDISVRAATSHVTRNAAPAKADRQSCTAASGNRGGDARRAAERWLGIPAVASER